MFSISKSMIASAAIFLMLGMSVSEAQAAKSLTIKSSQNNETETLQLPDNATLDIDVTADGIVLTIPNVNLSVKCLGLASAPNTCTLTAGGGTQSGDADGDGVPDGTDQCPNTVTGALTGSSGCSQDQQDADSDGVANGNDACPNTAANAQVDANGCSDTQNQPSDSDGDGVPDSTDQCDNVAGPATNNGCPVTNNPDTSEYCGGPEPGATVTCNATRNLDSIYANASLEEYGFGSQRVLSLPFSTADKSGQTDVFGSFKLVTDEASLPAVVGGERVKVWISLNPAGQALPGDSCQSYLQEATATFRWSQFPANFVCQVAELNQARTVYFNIAIACKVGETGCTASTQYTPHNGYDFRLTKYYQE